MKIRSCSPVPTSSPRIIAFPSYIRLERRLIHSLSIGQGTFLSNPSHRPDHIEVMDDDMKRTTNRLNHYLGRPSSRQDYDFLPFHAYRSLEALHSSLV